MVFINSAKWFENVLWKQWITGMSTCLMMFTLGLMIGWTSPYVAQLTSADSPLPITEDEASWVASLFNLGRLVGAFIGGIAIEYLGSKRTLVLLGVPAVLAWISIIIANSVVWLYISRLLGGISLGMILASFPLHLGEICHPTIRGTLVSLTISGLAMGTLIGNIMGPYMSMAVFSCISLIPNCLAFILLLWIPESPYYFVRKNEIKKAKESVTWYNPKADSKIVIDSVQKYIATAGSLTFIERLQEFCIPRNRRAGVIIVLLFFFMQFSGLNSLVYYMQSISTAAKLSIIDPAELAIIASTVGVAGGWFSICVADKLKRQHLMIISSTGIGISMLGIGTHFALLDYGNNPDNFQWLFILSSLLFNISVCSGVTTVPNMMLSELFAPEIKTMAAFIASISIGIFSFLATRSYQPVTDLIGKAWYFYSNSIIMVFSIIFALFFLPETKGKSLQEIQDNLRKR